MGSIRSWAFAPPINDEKFSGVGVPARHSTGLMVRRTHPTLSFGGTGFQPVRCTGKMPVPQRTFQGSSSWACAPPVNNEMIQWGGRPRPPY